VSGEATLNERAYATALMVVCDEILKTRSAGAVDSIEVLNQSGRQGFVFTAPAQCGEIMNAPASKYQAVVNAYTRPY
jgi:hypothetical protein